MLELVKTSQHPLQLMFWQVLPSSGCHSLKLCMRRIPDLWSTFGMHPMPGIC
jgi:hypothetical protein